MDFLLSERRDVAAAKRFFRKAIKSHPTPRVITRRIKHRIRPMLGFKRFETAAITISGIELAGKIRKHQFKTETLAGRPKPLQRFGPLSWLPDIPARLVLNTRFRPFGRVSTRARVATVHTKATRMRQNDAKFFLQ